MPVYVDNMTFVSKDKAAIARAIAELSTHFALRDLGSTNFLLGIEIEHDFVKQTVSLSQHRYIVDKFGMADCRPVKIPMVPGTHLEKASEEDAAIWRLFNGGPDWSSERSLALQNLDLWQTHVLCRPGTNATIYKAVKDNTHELWLSTCSTMSKTIHNNKAYS